MLDRIQTFGESLTEWMQKKGLTASSLAVFTQRTRDATIARLMHDQLDYQRCARFITELAESYPDMDEETLRRLRNAVDVNRYGKEMYAAMQDFFKMLESKKNAFLPVEAGTQAMLQQLLDWAGNKSFRMLCMGFTGKQPIQLLCMAAMARKDVHIYQFFCQSLVGQLSCLLSETLHMAFDPNYELYSVRDYPGIMLNNVLIVRREDGEHMIIVYDSGEFSMLRMSDQSNLFDFAMNILMAPGHSPKKINCHFSHNCPKAYLDFLEQCLLFEKDNSIYQIKNEIGLEYVPVDILYDNFSAWTQENDARFLPFLQQIKNVFAKRGENILQKAEPTYLIMTKSGMLDFVKTGRMKDHPFCLKAFTEEERLKIIQNLIDSSVHASSFTPLLFQDDALTLEYSFIGYSRERMLICKAQSDYDLADYTEIVINSDELSGQYADFVTNILTKNHVLGKKASMDFLQSLLAML